MIFRELIKSEIEKVPTERLEISIQWLRASYAQTRAQNGGPSFMSKLREVTIDGPDDFAENVDLYVTGEKTWRS